MTEMIEAVERLQAKVEFPSLAINTLRQAHDKTTAGMQSIWDTFERQYKEKGLER